MELNSVRRIGDGKEHISEFEILALKIVEFGKQAGVVILPFSSPQYPFFSRLDEDKKREVLKGMRVFVNACEHTISAGKSLRDSPTLVWFGLKELGYRFRSDLFSIMDESHIVEVYNANNIQVFRNFNFFSIVSYTLEDVFCRPWMELFIRENPVQTQKILELVGKFFDGSVREVVPFDHVGTHRITEVESPFHYKIDLVINSLAPVYDENWQPAGGVAVETGSVKTARPFSDEEMRQLQDYYRRNERNLQLLTDQGEFKN